MEIFMKEHFLDKSYTLDQIDIKSNSYYLMNNMMFNKLIEQVKFSLSDNLWKLAFNVRKDKELLNWIKTSIPILNGLDVSISTYINWILTNRINLPVCKICGNYLKKIKIGVFQLYAQHCSAKCRANNPEYQKYLADRIEEKYGPGIRSTLQIPEVREKSLETLYKNYGYDHPFKHPTIRAKVEQSFMQNYGAKNNMQSEKGMAEYKKSINEKYGVDYTWQLSSVQEKSRQSTFDHFGVYVSSQAQSVKDKQAETNIILYGHKSALQNEDVHKKTIQTLQNNYGVDHPSKSPEIRKKQIYNVYEYAGLRFNSSWEIAFWIYCKDHDIDINREPEPLDYVDSMGVLHKYFPDFKINGNLLVEIKGDDQFDKKTGKMIDKLDPSKNYIAEAKYNCMIENHVMIIRSNDIKKYIDYVEQTYGKGYLKQFKKKSKSSKIQNHDQTTDNK